MKIRERLAGRAAHFLDEADAAFGIDQRAFLLAPAGGGQHKIRALRGFGRRIHVLHDEEIELLQDLD